ncbi:hypothetical protein A9P82_02955 [Arachidicoccus ginsenosidimutans]|uniref:porin family protein n=1 Tax=Arachidicoccus sp. BS20 TaxID=1850526 RepID=UPI0007F141F1|nr:porin family protein [Arachidicoccus sp. BS20]ANI88350.1 hypothetical protein A9P82_02955 [Arachidicoccus sp. BS20]
MKKIYLFLGLLTITTIAFSQTSRKITYGIHAGVNLAKMTDKDQGISTTTSSKAGFIGGVDVEFHISPAFSIQPELNFSQMGGKIGYDTLSTTLDEKFTLDYLSLPILAKYTIPNSGFSIYAGPQVSYLLHSSVSVSSEQGEGSQSASASSLYQKGDFSGIAGVEYYLPQGFGISARYQFGFINTWKTVEDASETVKNHGFTFTVGYRF